MDPFDDAKEKKQLFNIFHKSNGFNMPSSQQTLEYLFNSSHWFVTLAVTLY